MKSRNLFLGIIILFVGVIALLAALNVIDFSWIVAGKLWPMLLIIMGIAIIVLLVNFLVDVIYRIVDPRIGMEDE